jgi:electron transfer flavoprotein alpha subunit
MPELLLLAESDGAKVAAATLPAISFAQEFANETGGRFDILVLGGPGIAEQAEGLRGYGAERILIAAAPELVHPVADIYAAAAVQAMKASGAVSIAGPSSTFGRDVLPRVAALLDLPMLSDVLNVSKSEGELHFKRPMYAGNIIATIKIEGDAGVFSVRGTSYGKPEAGAGLSAVESLSLDADELPHDTEWISLDAPEAKRPDVTNARVVVSGGRPLKDAETFERVIGGLADKLGGGTGATRAAVDSGIAPNECQVGQTGKVVAPDLYIAAGVSGSVQHMAGMKESKVIVAINTDPEAPIYEIADYGLVQDLFTAIPELQSRL